LAATIVAGEFIRHLASSVDLIDSDLIDSHLTARAAFPAKPRDKLSTVKSSNRSTA